MLSILALAAAWLPFDDPRLTSTEGGLHPEPQLFDRTYRVGETPLAAGGALTYGATPGGFSVNEDPEGDMPREVAFLPDGSAAVIVNRDTDTLTFFDVASRTITDTVAVGDFPVHVAVTPDGQYAVVPNVLDHTVSVVDVATRTLAATIPVTGEQPYRVAVTTDSAFAVVGVIEDAVVSRVSVIDLATFGEVRSFTTTSQGVFGGFFTPEAGIFGNLFTQFALSSDDTTLVLPDRGNARVALYDVTTGAQLALLATADLPTAVDISADGQLAVVAHGGNTGVITTIDVPTASVLASLVTPHSMSSQRVRVTPDKAYAIAGVLNEVQFVDLATGATTALVSTGTVGDIEISFDGQYAIVSNFNLRVIDIASQSLVRTISFASCYEGATSPVEHRHVALNNRFAEDVQLYDTSGAAGFFEGFALSGEIEEGDAPRELALSADGSRALVVNNTSRNACIVDVAAGSVLAYVPTSGRSLGGAITPDGTTGLVVNAGDSTLTVFDMATGAVQAVLSVPSTPTEVVVSPDSQTAYVAAVAGTDRLWFVDLAGAASSVTGSLITGQMGSIGYTYGVFSGLSIAPDGSLVAVCISFDDELLLVDTATQSEVARLPVDDFPIRATFAPDGSRLYVTHSFGDSLVAIDVNGAASSVAGTLGGIEFPLQVDVDDAGAYSYVGSFDFSNPRLIVVDNASLSIAATVALSSRPRSSSLAGGDLLVTGTDGELFRIDAAGPATSLTETLPLSGSPADLVFSTAVGRVLCSQPGPEDRIDVIDLGTPGTSYCTSTPNSSGLAATMGASGSLSISTNSFFLHASGAALSQPGIFFYGPNQVFIPFGNGFRCVGGQASRLSPPAPTDASGSLTRQLDFTQPPANGGPGLISPGQTVNFQFWFRDPLAGGSFFDLSDGLSATFQP